MSHKILYFMETVQKLSRKDAILYLAEQKEGMNEALQTLIGKDLFEQFVRMGFISRGKDKWKITEQGMKQSQFYRPPTVEEATLGRFYWIVGRIFGF